MIKVRRGGKDEWENSEGNRTQAMPLTYPCFRV